MNTTEYIPVNKRKFIRKMINLEANNRALQKKLSVYENIFKTQLVNVPKQSSILFEQSPTNLVKTQNHFNADKQCESEEIKKHMTDYIENPTKHENLIPELVSILMHKNKRVDVDSKNIKMFLNDY